MLTKLSSMSGSVAVGLHSLQCRAFYLSLSCGAGVGGSDVHYIM